MRTNYQRIQQETLEEQQTRASIRDFFLEQDSAVIQQLLKDDLQKYYNDQQDISDMKLITLDYFIPAFMEKICSVYNKPPLFKFEGGDDINTERLNSLIEETDLHQIMADNMIKMKMHNTILCHCKYNAEINKVVVENGYNIGTALVWELPEHYYEPMIIAYPHITGTNECYYIVWDKVRGLHYIMDDMPKYDPIARDLLGMKMPVGENKDLTVDLDYFPWTVYRYRRQNTFWGNGMDSVVELIRSINSLLTVCQDDTIREAIRILIMGFEPSGTKDIKGRIKTGIRNPIFNAGSFTGDNVAPTEILSADLYTEQILSYVQNLVDMVSATYSVENVLKTEMKQDLSGIALRMKNEPLLRQWASDIMKMRNHDRELIRKIIDCNNYHRPDNFIDPSIMDRLTVDYQQPQVISDEKADYELLKLQVEDGVVSFVDYVMKNNPEMDREDAVQMIKDNLEETEQLFGMDLTTEKIESSLESFADQDQINE